VGGHGESERERDAGPDSIEHLLAKLRPVLAAIFWRSHISPVDAEDLLQNALLSLVSHRSSILNEQAWLLGAVRRQCAMYWRQRRRRLYDAIDTACLQTLAGSAPSEQQNRELRCDLSTTIAKLPARCRSILRLRYGLGCDAEEVAARLGYKESSMHKVTSRCLSALALSFAGASVAGPRP
jgi:RNA polymerase sigma factor (sigma-70 family)